MMRRVSALCTGAPASVLLDSVLDYLQACFEQGWLDYESGLLRQ